MKASFYGNESSDIESYQGFLIPNTYAISFLESAYQGYSFWQLGDRLDSSSLFQIFLKQGVC